MANFLNIDYSMLLVKSVIISLWTVALYQCFQENFIFHKICKQIHKITDRCFSKENAEWIRRPLCSCPICMSSVWTILPSPLFGLSLIEIPFVIFLVCGINTVYVHLIKK